MMPAHFAEKLTNWLFRKCPPFLIPMKLSGWILVAALGSGIVSGSISIQDYKVEFIQGDSVAFAIINLIALLSVFVFAASFIGHAACVVVDKRQESKKKIIVIEGRGLRDDDGTSLADSIGNGFPKSPDSCILDLRQRLDGKIVDHEILVPKIAIAKYSINQKRAGNGRDQTQIAYGGLTAVPLTFLTGIELDDEGKIFVFDWDRSSERWRPLDGLDDDLRLSEPNISDLPFSKSVVLAISVSYPIDQNDILTSFKIPVVRMELEGMSSNSHWSDDKQAALANQFFEMAKKLSARGIRHIHLVLAAPNSVVFNFGRRYGKRNLPVLTVYQYERAEEIKYPWGVRMPVGETCDAYVERAIPVEAV